MSRNASVLDRPIAPNAHELLRGRRSIRHYRAEYPSIQTLERIFASAAMAPSAHNRQPWRYLVITEHAAKVRLAGVMGERLIHDRRRDGDAEEAIQADVTRSFDRITRAPVVVLVALTLCEMDGYSDERRSGAEYLMAVQSTAMATQNLLLAAHAEGLGTCWMCAPLFCPDEVCRELALPDDWQPQGLVTLGYPGQPGRLRPRKLVREFVVFDDGKGQVGCR